jgi:hypothetical protein
MFKRSKSESGQAMMEFALVTIFLTFLFAGAFTVGMMLTKALQVSNVTRTGAVLLVRSVTDPNNSLNMATATNQRMLVREANGLGMAKDAQFDPDPNGNGAIFLSKIVMVGDTECANPAAGLTAHANPPFWDNSNCANYGSYVWEYYVAIGNTTKWASALGTPPTADVQADGSISPVHVATLAGVIVPSSTMTPIMTLSSSQYALFSEMYADVSNIAVFSGYWKPPIVYYRTIT